MVGQWCSDDEVVGLATGDDVVVEDGSGRAVALAEVVDEQRCHILPSDVVHAYIGVVEVVGYSVESEVVSSSCQIDTVVSCVRYLGVSNGGVHVLYDESVL